MTEDLPGRVPPRASAFVWSRERLEAYFRGAAFALLLILGAVASVRAYFAMETAILTWFRPQWVAIAQAAYSLVMLGIIIWLLRAWVIAKAK